MGVPKFYRWVSERYPCLSETVRENEIPDFDNLYLDMNGIIHNCSHPNDEDPHFRISEENIIKDIFHYIEVLFRMIRPSKVFFMAIDGVAPRAKMNQQRGRRFKTARAAEEAEVKAKAKCESLPSEARFDSNCITPGTHFMTRLDAQLQYFISNKISTDKSWQDCCVIYSGHKTPGEGEHKIMEYIRYARSQPAYNPSTRHCLYGLDADLMMLGLTSHEPNFSLLREEVKFTKSAASKRTVTPEETTFHLLHLSLMREYINYEFSDLKTVPFGYDLEAIIDDFVFLGFLVGNDFIPHLPGLHIQKEGLPTIYQVYKNALLKMDGYINEKGTLNLKRFEIFMADLTEFDVQQFEEVSEGIKFLAGKRAEANERADKLEEFEFDASPEEEDLKTLEGALTKEEISSTFARLGIEQSTEFDCSDDEDSEKTEEDTFKEEFRQHKYHYYRDKMGFKSITAQVLRDQAFHYVQGLQWILNYYYNGICSWSWYYPFHYAPYISDVKNFSDMKFTYSKGRPFLPFEQLLAVLPPNSVGLLPTPYHHLMLEETSLVTMYYPKNFETDLNGKTQDWEAVVLVPFIDEDILLQAMKPCNERLAIEEQSRNVHGPHHLYTYTEKSLGILNAPAYFPPITFNHAALETQPREVWDIDPVLLVKGLLPDVDFNVYYEGFPTLRHIDHTFRIKSEGVKVFQQPSRCENVILQIEVKTTKLTPELVEKLLAKPVHVSWPQLTEAVVVSVSDGSKAYCQDEGKLMERPLNSGEKEKWTAERKGLEQRLLKRWGIDVGKTKILVQVKHRSGLKYVCSPKGEVTLQKQWNETPTYYPLQVVVTDIDAFTPSYKQYDNMLDLYTPGTRVFMIGRPYYGSSGTVHGTNTIVNGRVRITAVDAVEPNLSRIVTQFGNIRSQYMTSYTASQYININCNLFSRITGTILLAPAKELNPVRSRDNFKYILNIGMNLKSNKKNEEVVGFTAKCLETNSWLYSLACVRAVEDYQRNFPEIFSFLTAPTRHNTKDAFHEDDIFPDDYETKVSQLRFWLKSTAFSKALRQKIGTQRVDENAVPAILEEVAKVSQARAHSQVMQVKPHLLFKPNHLQGTRSPDPTTTYQLWDRVVNVRDGYSVPLGARGTIIGLRSETSDINDFYEVLFDEPFAGGLRLCGEKSAGRCYKLQAPALINISHGQRQQRKPSKTKYTEAEEYQFFASNTQNNESETSQNQTPTQPAANFPDIVPADAKPAETMVQATPDAPSVEPASPSVEPASPSAQPASPSAQPPEPDSLPSLGSFGSIKRPNKVELARPLETLVYATDYMRWPIIQKNGLFKDYHDYVVCRRTPLADDQVVIYLNLHQLAAMQFRILLRADEIYCSTLSSGFIPPSCFEKVIDLQTQQQIYPLKSAVPLDELPLPSVNGLPDEQFSQIWSQIESAPPRVMPDPAPHPARFVPTQVSRRQVPVSDTKPLAAPVEPPVAVAKKASKPVKKTQRKAPKQSRLAANLSGLN